MRIAATFALVLLLPACLLAQTVCPTGHSKDMICMIPGVYGPNGLVGTNVSGPLMDTSSMPVGTHGVDFSSAASVSLTLVTAGIGTQLSQLPLAAPASGVTFSLNSETGALQETLTTLGPILNDRANTIGRHKVFVGVSYQFFEFDRADGTNLRSIPALYNHERRDIATCNQGDLGCAADGYPIFAHDTISTVNRVDLKVHQITPVLVFGLTNRLDISVAVPILHVGGAIRSSATINTFERAPTDPNATDPMNMMSCENNPMLSSMNMMGCMHQFDPMMTVAGESAPSFANDVQGYNQATFSSSSSAAGIGDVVFRGKFQAVKGEKAGLSVGVDLHTPTGSAEKFLGSGAWGVRPFGIFSYAGRIEPHAGLGFQINGDSILGVQPSTILTNINNGVGSWPQGGKGHLPNVFNFDAGLDAGITKKLSLSGDFIGQTFFGVQTLAVTHVLDYAGNLNATVGAPSVSNGRLVFPAGTGQINSNQLSIAAGAKVRPFGNFILTGNVLFRVNNAGLHYKPAPLIGVSYTF